MLTPRGRMNDIGNNILALLGGLAALAAIYMYGGIAALLGFSGGAALMYSFAASLSKKRKEKERDKRLGSGH